MWVRARRQDDGTTLVEVARLDRSSGGDPEDGAAELGEVVAALQEETGVKTDSNRRGRVVTDAQWEVFSYEAVIGAAVLYFLAMLAYFFELASLRTASKEVETVSVGADGGGASHAVAVDQEPAPSRRSEVAGRLGSS